MSADETWRDVPDWEGLYRVSDQGRVWSVRVDKEMKASTGGHYPLVTLSPRGGGKKCSRPIHKIVAHAFIGPRPPGLEVRHLNGDAFDNHLTNLKYGTKAENMRDAVRHGTHGKTAVTHCPQDHPYDEQNTYYYRTGRYCRACRYAGNKARRGARPRVAA